MVISFFLLLLVNLCNWQRLQQLERFCERQTLGLKASLNISSDEILVFFEGQLANAEWENQHEFILDGFVYDVLKTENKNGQKLYTVYQDQPESHVKQEKMATFALNLSPKHGPLVLGISHDYHFKFKPHVAVNFISNIQLFSADLDFPIFNKIFSEGNALVLMGFASNSAPPPQAI